MNNSDEDADDNELLSRCSPMRNNENLITQQSTGVKLKVSTLLARAVLVGHYAASYVGSE